MGLLWDRRVLMMSGSSLSRTRAFISYSHKGNVFLDHLQSYLKLYLDGNEVDVWDDTRIGVGAKWEGEIEQALASARIAVLLISIDFLTSTFIRERELPRLLAAATQGQVALIPVIVRPCPLERVKELAQIQTINSPSKPVNAMLPHEQDALWMDVAERMSQALSVPGTTS